jgi:aminoglycoside phosphotransferase (APT) family kinase protein
MLTPRFRASSHVVFIVFSERSKDAALVVKVPRLEGDDRRIKSEAQNLRSVHAARSGGFDSIPQLVGFEQYRDRHYLIESAIAGESLSSHLKTNPVDTYSETVTTWLIDLHQATLHRSCSSSAWYDQLVTGQLAQLSKIVPADGRESLMVHQTLESTDPIRCENVPFVCEHGDLGPPNVLVRGNDRIGVVDWELANPRGLPAADLFFFLTLVAFNRRRARRKAEYLAAFDEAFFGSTPSARPYITRYARSLDLPAAVISQLFVLSWARYVTNLVTRLHDTSMSNEPIGNRTIEWLRSNRYYAIWCHTLKQAHRLNLIA